MGEEQAHYLFSVRRFKEGGEINIFDGTGKSYKAQITKISKTAVEGKIISEFPFVLPKHKITLYTAVPKGDRFEWLVEKAAELGIYKVVPLITERSAAETFSANKLARLNKISIAASSQSGRADIMAVASPAYFKDAIKADGLKIVAYEGGVTPFIETITKAQAVNIFIGPEGGFTNAEIEAAQSAGAATASLGKNILRVETAAIVCAALMLDYDR